MVLRYVQEMRDDIAQWKADDLKRAEELRRNPVVDKWKPLSKAEQENLIDAFLNPGPAISNTLQDLPSFRKEAQEINALIRDREPKKYEQD